MLQGDAGAGRASDDSCHWFFKAKFPLQAPVGRILAQVASGTSLCYTFQKSLELGWLIVAALNSKTVEEGLYFDLVPLLNLEFHCRRTLQTSHRHIVEQQGEVAEAATRAEVVILEDFFYLACILAHNLLQASWHHLVSLHHLHELSEGQWLNDHQPGHVELLQDFVCYEGHADLNDELAKRYIIGKTPRKSPHCGSDGVALVVDELIRAVSGGELQVNDHRPTCASLTQLIECRQQPNLLRWFVLVRLPQHGGEKRWKLQRFAWFQIGFHGQNPSTSPPASLPEFGECLCQHAWLAYSLRPSDYQKGSSHRLGSGHLCVDVTLNGIFLTWSLGNELASLPKTTSSRTCSCSHDHSGSKPRCKPHSQQGPNCSLQKSWCMGWGKLHGLLPQRLLFHPKRRSNPLPPWQCPCFHVRSWGCMSNRRQTLMVLRQKTSATTRGTRYEHPFRKSWQKCCNKTTVQTKCDSQANYPTNPTPFSYPPAECSITIVAEFADIRGRLLRNSMRNFLIFFWEYLNILRRIKSV